MSDEDFDDVVNVHLRGHFTLVRAIAGHWRERAKPSDELQSQRSLVLVSSHAALGNPGQANYSAAKAGVLGLMRTAARELYRYNVRTNALLPRAYTRFVETMPDEVRPEEHEVASPEDIAPVVAYLISDGAVDTVGCTITAAGDRIGLMADPTIERFSVKSDGWGIEELSEHFSETLGRGTTLKRVDHQF
jgi:NAD(P)-dependent dehydrogenase (short-subunit alcohol dehydrogenase family)